MTVTIDAHVLLVAAIIWCGIGAASYAFWDIHGVGIRKWLTNWIDSPFKMMWDMGCASVFGPLVFVFYLIIWALFDELLNRKW
jgi:hypothetical protein